MNDTASESGLSVDKVLNALSDPICLIDGEGNVLSVNTFFLSLFTDIAPEDNQQTYPLPPELEREIAIILSGMQRGISGGKFQSLVRTDDGMAIYTFTVTPITGQSPSYLIRAYPFRRTAERSQFRDNFLFGVLHILSRFSVSSKPEREINELLRTFGLIMGSHSVSFFQPDPSLPEIPEVYVWSDEETNAPLTAPLPERVTIRSDPPLQLKNPFHGTIDQVPEYFRAVMASRHASSVQIFPAFSQSVLIGVCVFWSGDEEPWADVEVAMIGSLVSIIGQHLYWSDIENKLVRNEGILQGILEYIGDMYFLTDADGDILMTSPSMVRTLEYTDTDELYGTNMQSLLRYPETWPSILSDLLRDSGIRDFELVLSGKLGKLLVCSLSCRLTYDTDGSLLGIEGVLRDITRRKQYDQIAYETEWRLREAQKIARLGVWSFSLAERAFRVSPEFFTILALPLSKGTVSLDDITSLTPAGDRLRLEHHFSQTIPEGEEFEIEFKIIHQNGKFKYLKMKGEPIKRIGEVRGSFGILQDITERKEVEEYLLKYANELEKKTVELDELRTQLLDMNRDLDQRVRNRSSVIEELLRQKDEFIVQIGHDLKTPLTPLVAILPHLRKKITDPDLVGLLDMAIEDVRTIKKMISRILDLAQMNALLSGSDIEQVQLSEAVSRIIRDNAYLIHQKSLRVDNLIPPGIAVHISPMHFETMMANLICNAVKYSYLDGIITISAVDQGEIVTMQISDTGIGIAEKDLFRIFEEFYKADASRHDLDSHGLGLTIAKRVVEMYNGKIWAESNGPGKGSTFYVQIKKDPLIRIENSIPRYSQRPNT